jgi:hypothetical protein
MVTATATNAYKDLFRALKGGANRFGIVTRYALYPVHVGTAADKNWYGGLIVVSRQGNAVVHVDVFISLSSLALSRRPSVMRLQHLFVKIQIPKLVSLRDTIATKILNSL